MTVFDENPLCTGVVVIALAWAGLSVALGLAGAALLLAAVLAAGVAVALRVGSNYTNEAAADKRPSLAFLKAGSTATFPASSEPPVTHTVVAPCFNEARRIGRMIEDTVAFFKQKGESWELIIVDDGSTDDSIKTSLDHALRLGVQDCVKVLPVMPNRGKGYAVKQGVFASSGQYILMADADAATDIRDLDKLLPFLKTRKGPTYDIVIGSRAHLEEESQATRSFLRTILMHIFHFCVSFTFAFSHTHTHLRDTQCGFKLFKRDAAMAMFSNLRIERWAFDVELLVAASILQYRVHEVQVRWEEIDGSKMSVKGMVRMGLECLLTCVNVRCGMWKVRKP
ncbi:Dolichyl-phosphate beta-glucosyltransferase [Diplonema papillatum]|nr:Dolichyl-phosphate beta-glucosyltransferase [Diplonema papillatum]